jgi:glycosyltransferase involved in cell wall biosynthesis
MRADNMKRDVLQNFMIKHSSCKKDSPFVLIWELGGFPAILIKNALFSCALNVRGYNTHFLICDRAPEACIQRSLDQNEKLEDWSKRCAECLTRMKDMAAKYCVPYSLTGDYIAEGQKQIFRTLSEQIAINEIINYKYLGVFVGALAWNSVNRYMKGYLVNMNELKEEDETIYRKYLYAALVNTYIADAAIEKLKPVSILTSHGVYVDYNPPMSLAYLKGLNAVSWSSGFSNHCHYFTTAKGIDKPGLRGITEREWEKRKNRPLTAGENKILDDIIHDRYFGNKALDLEIKSKPEDEITLREKLRINDNNPIVTLFAHVNWDAVFNLGNMLFDNANQWVIESIEKMSEIRDVNWIIRLHPGEKYNGSLFTTGDLIRKEFENIPEHIKIIWNDSEVNSYGLYRLIDAGITIFGTVGAELPLFGKPVVSVGDARFSGKGFTIDAKSKEEYFSILENVRDLKPLTDRQKELARRYAYSYFVQTHVPLKIMNKKEGHWGNIDLTRLEELLPGNDPILDKTCEGIIHGKDVILDEEITCGRTDGVSDLKEVYSGDQQGEIIIGDNNVFRIIHKSEETNVRKILDLIGEDLENLQIVHTKIVADKNILKQLNASEDQLVLEHKRISSITYPHEWPPSMLQDAALFQLKLSAALLSKGLYLKDAHPLNILFESGKPVLVDFTSIVTKEALFNESYLKGNSKYKNEPENIRISVLILEIYKRMFLPYFYIPLCAYAFGNKKGVGTIMHETTLNTSKRATTLTSAINEYELNRSQVADNLKQVEKIFGNFVNDLDTYRLFDSLYSLIQQLPVASRKSGYTNYYEEKDENQNYTQIDSFNEKQEAVFEALNQESIKSVLDIGANTGWYSLMAEHMGKQVLCLDTDVACIELLYERVKENGINIQPIVTDFAKISSERPSLYDNKPVLLDGYYRFCSDSVMVLGLLHHLVLGLGMGFDEIFSKIDLLSGKQLILEYVSIDDSLIQAEPEFFPEFYRNPHQFGFYNLDNLLRSLKNFYSYIKVKWSTKGTRMILVCEKERDSNKRKDYESEKTEQSPQLLTIKDNARTKILFTTSVLEHPPAGGPALRIENSIKALSNVSELHVVSRIPKTRIGRDDAENYYSSICRNFGYSPSAIKEGELKEDADYLINYADRNDIGIIWFGYGNISYDLMKEIKTRRPDFKIVCDTDSVYSRYVLREIPFEDDPARREQILDRGRKKEREEADWVRFCDVTTAVSQVDADYYKSLAEDSAKIKVFSNVIDLDSYGNHMGVPNNFKKPCMYLAGSFFSPKCPMVRAAKWVISDIMPAVRYAIPDIHFYIIGNGSDTMLKEITDPSITITGKLDSVLPYLCNSDVALVPLMFESGTRFKILEAAACNIPIVSTTLGAEGIPVTNGKDILIADVPTEFADAIVTLIRNKEVAGAIADNCRELVRAKYSVEYLTTEAEEILDYLMSTELCFQV